MRVLPLSVLSDENTQVSGTKETFFLAAASAVPFLSTQTSSSRMGVQFGGGLLITSNLPASAIGRCRKVVL